jgi:hypothetical protein
MTPCNHKAQFHKKKIQQNLQYNTRKHDKPC